MNKREINEIKRRLSPDKHNISCIRGCYVNEQNEIISVFNNSAILMLQEEVEKYLAIFKRTLSGTPGKNSIDVDFSTGQVSFDEQHKLLMKLKESALRNDDAVNEFFNHIIESVKCDSNYLILLMCDTYDVPSFSKDGKKSEEESNEVFTYIICSVCPVKMTKTALSYDPQENNFHNSKLNWIVIAPEFGFMFPTFENRRTNIYHSLFYSKSSNVCLDSFFQNIFNTTAPMSADTQKETFCYMLSDSLKDECNYDVIQTVNDQLCEIIEEHKEQKLSDIPVISKNNLKNLLEVCGVSESKLTVFEEQYEENFGSHTELSVQNVVNEKQFEVKTDDVFIKTTPDKSDLIEIKNIDGIKYIMIRTNSDIEVNGVKVSTPFSVSEKGTAS